MAAEKTSAEKDLLKIIENPGSAEAARKVQTAAQQNVQTGAARKGLFAFLFPVAAPGTKSKPLTLAAILSDKQLMIKLLALLTFWIFVAFCITLIREYTKLNSLKSLENAAQTVREEKPKSVTTTVQAKDSANPAPPAEVSGLEQVVRNIFKPAEAQKKPVEEKKDEFANLMQEYKLVGISIAADPSQSYAMVENTKTKITLFLKKGENLNGAELSDITEEMLVFKAGGRQIELR